MSSPQAEHCRRKAEECDEEGRRAQSPSHAHTWLNLARQWRELADRIDRNTR